MIRSISPSRRRPRSAAATVAALAAFAPLAAACSSDSAPTAAPAASSASVASASAQRTSACRPVPVAAEALPWLPPDLPLPDGTYAIADPEAPAGASTTSAAAPAPDQETHRGFLAVHGSVTDFSSFIATQWVAKGWTLGKGDAERGEAEGGYRKGDFGGAFRVRDVYCDPSFSELLITYGKGATSDP